MAGTRGPVPKRTDERRRTNSTGPVTKAPAAKKFRRPPANPRWHSTAKLIYKSMAESGQAAFMEPSDWALAKWICDEISEYRYAPKKSAVHFESLMQATARLMMTEGDRRRLRIELEREGPGVKDPDEEAAVTSIDEWRQRLSSS